MLPMDEIFSNSVGASRWGMLVVKAVLVDLVAKSFMTTVIAISG
jgi:hypothetical protein